MKKILSMLLCCLLLATMVFSLVACPGADPTPTPGPTPGPGENDDPPGGNDDPPTPPPADPTYGEGEAIADTGAAEFADDAFIRMVDGLNFTTTPGTVSADDFVSTLRSEQLEEFAPYTVDGEATVSGLSDVTVNGMTAQISAPEGLVFENCSNLTVTNLLLKGTISFVNCENVTLTDCYFLNPNGVALSIDATTVGVSATDILVSGKNAIRNASDNLKLTDIKIAYTETGLADTSASGLLVYNCVFNGTGTALSVTGSDAYIRRNTMSCGDTNTGILLAGTGDFTMNDNLVAENVITGAKYGVLADGQRNTSIVLNSMKSVKVLTGHAVYVCSNALGGRLEADTVNYFLADKNTYPDDGQNHTAVQKNTTNTNGDTITDVDARVEYGANEDLLPHVDKDLFLGSATKATVTDPTLKKAYDIKDYIRTVAFNEGPDRIVVAPGKYRCPDQIILNQAAHNDTDVYAYGVYAEDPSTTSFHNMICVAANNVTFRGIIVGFARQSCGQVYVLEKLNGYSLRVITGAGMVDAFGMASGLYGTQGMGAHHESRGEFFAYCDTSFGSITAPAADHTMVMTVGSTLYDNTEPGDVFTCRSLNSNNTYYIANSKNVTFLDTVMYGNSGGFAVTEGNNYTSTNYYRVLNTTKNGAVIDKATYDRYKALEEQYGVDLQLSIDEQGRYRGSLPHIGSIDATHTTGCAQGSVAISCIFENMCDDATNQNHTHARLHTYKDNGDNTITFTYKPNLSRWSFENGSRKPGGLCKPYKVGDRVYIYTRAGQLVYDGPALTVTTPNGTTNFSIDGTNGTIALYEVKVQKSGDGVICNLGALVNYNLSDNNFEETNKVLVDNMSMASNGFLFDNCIARNIRSRGLLIKASDAAIKHCTFNHIGMSCAAILYEIYWGESGVTENLEVSNNLFDHTGYFNNSTLYAPVSITGLGTQADENFLLYKNISIVHNKFVNRTTTYAVYVNSAKDTVIKDNWIGMMEGEEDAILNDDADAKSRIGCFIGAKNIEVSGNYFEVFEKGYIDDVAELFRGSYNYVHVYGSDVEYEDGAPILEDDV